MDPAATFVPLTQGFLLGASLTIAIGSQNAFALRQPLRSHTLPPLPALR